jgi:monoamine oxidase
VDGGGFVDWGGQWVGPTQTRFNALIDEMGCKRYTSPGTKGDYMVRGIDGRLVRVSDNGPQAAGQDTVDDIYEKITELANGISPHAPWEAKDAKELDSTTFAQWLRDEKLGDPRAREWAGVEVGSVPSASPAEISMLQLGWLIHSCESIKSLFDFDGGAQQDRVVGGTQPVAQKIADRLGGAVKLGKPVRRIVKTDSGSMEVYADGLVVNAKHVIVALPPNLAGAIEYEPSLPTARTQVTQRWPQGLVVKVSMVYRERLWARNGQSGKSFDYTAFMSETADSSNSEDDGAMGILTGFVYADKAREILLKSSEERKAILLAEVEKRFELKAMANPVNYHETNWSMQQWTRGCFTGFLTPGATTLFKSAVREHCGPIHWAGTETATEWPSFIEGAIRSGERAANEVVQNA